MAGENGKEEVGSKEEEEESREEEEESVHTDLRHLGRFTFQRLLSDCPERKSAVVQASVAGSAHPAILVLEKLPLTADTAAAFLAQESQVEQEFTNDIYGQYRLLPPPLANTVKANIIHPATSKHLAKYLASPAHLVLETPALHRSTTLPCLAAEQFSLQWVYNVLEHRKEVERIVFEDPDPATGFILAPDFKWNGKQTNDLYCLAIVHRRGIRSLRDLTAAHLPLLRNVLRGSRAAVRERWGLQHSQVRCYLHYQPSYFHLHVHVTALDYTPPGVSCEKAHLLESVIANLELDPSFYRRATLPFVAREREALYAAYREQGYFEEREEGEVAGEAEAAAFPACLRLWECLGRAKHEPCGEFWETSYGESSWRMAVMALCLAPALDRQRLVHLALASSLASIGATNDENTEWGEKVEEVTRELFAMLPAGRAGLLAGRFGEHAEVRRGRLDGSREHTAYRGVLELEEVMLRWEEEVKDGTTKATEVEVLLAKMARVGFPGAEEYRLLGDRAPLRRLLAFWLQLSQLQKLRRTGWLRSGVREPETVAGHMYRMAVMGALVDQEGDTATIALCHDMAECIIGDITPHCKVSSEEKAAKEMEAFKQLVAGLPSHVVGEVFGAFKRYEEQEEGDRSARVAKDLDRFDMVVQAWEYEKRDKRGAYLQQFFDSTMAAFATPLVRAWHAHLLQHRQDHFAEA